MFKRRYKKTTEKTRNDFARNLTQEQGDGLIEAWNRAVKIFKTDKRLQVENGLTLEARVVYATMIYLTKVQKRKDGGLVASDDELMEISSVLKDILYKYADRFNINIDKLKETEVHKSPIIVQA